MKKKIIGITLMAAIAIAAGFNVIQNESEISLSDLALSNVEALASSESSGDFTAATGCVACICSSSCRNNSHSYRPS